MTRKKTKKKASIYNILQAVCKTCSQFFRTCICIYPMCTDWCSISFIYSKYTQLLWKNYFFHFLQSITKVIRKRIKFSTVVSLGKTGWCRVALGGGVGNVLFFTFSEAATGIRYYAL